MSSDTRDIPKDRFHDRNRQPRAAAAPDAADAPLEIEPDSDDERPGYGWEWNQAAARQNHDDQHQERQLQAERAEVHHAAELEAQARLHSNGESTTSSDPSSPAALPSAAGSEAGHMSSVLHWALDCMHEPALAAADWLARDIDPQQPTAASLLTDPSISLERVKKAKSVFKTMRIVGEKSADRRVGARMYAAAIAAALVRHNTLISTQSDDALKRAFQSLLDDKHMPASLRDLAGMAMCALAERPRSSRPTGNGQPPTPQPGEHPIPMPRRATPSMPRRKRA